MVFLRDTSDTKRVANGNSNEQLWKYSYSKRMCSYDVLSSLSIRRYLAARKAVYQKCPKNCQRPIPMSKKSINSYKCLHLRGIVQDSLQKIANSSACLGYTIVKFKNGYLNITSPKQTHLLNNSSSF